MKFLKYGFIFIGTLFMILIAIGVFKRDFDSKASVTIQAPIADVFATYNNPQYWNQWQAEFDSFELINGSLTEVGSKWLMNYQSGQDNSISMQHTLTAFMNNQKVAYDYENEWLAG